MPDFTKCNSNLKVRAPLRIIIIIIIIYFLKCPFLPHAQLGLNVCPDLRPHSASYPSETHHTSISPSCTLLSRLSRFSACIAHVSVLYVNTLWTQALKIFSFKRCDAPRAVRMGDSSLSLSQAHQNLALVASSTPPAPSVSPN